MWIFWSLLPSPLPISFLTRPLHPLNFLSRSWSDTLFCATNLLCFCVFLPYISRQHTQYSTVPSYAARCIKPGGHSCFGPVDLDSCLPIPHTRSSVTTASICPQGWSCLSERLLGPAKLQGRLTIVSTGAQVWCRGPRLAACWCRHSGPRCCHYSWPQGSKRPDRVQLWLSKNHQGYVSVRKCFKQRKPSRQFCWL